MRRMIAVVSLTATMALPATASPQTDKWKVATTKDQMNDRSIVTATLQAETPARGWLTTTVPTLVVRCKTPPPTDPLVGIAKRTPFLPVQPGLDVYVVTGTAASVENAEGKHTIRVRFDGQLARQWNASESTNDTSLFLAPALTVQMVVTDQWLVTSKRMLFEFTPFKASPVIITFAVTGFDTHVDQVLAGCPVVDKTQWRFPPGQEPAPHIR
jgi:hypothetical protein